MQSVAATVLVASSLVGCSTYEEISKLLKNEFTNEDLVNLVIRIKESKNQQVKTK